MPVCHISMTGNELNSLFGQQKDPKPETMAVINALNYKLTDVLMLADRLLDESPKKELVFTKFSELKAAIDSAAIHNL